MQKPRRLSHGIKDVIRPRSSGFTPEQTQFIRDKQFLKRVTEKTLLWYGVAFKEFEECDTLPQYHKRIVELLERGVKSVSVNSWLSCINTFEHWRAAPGDKRTVNGRCCVLCNHPKLEMLKVDHMILATFTPDDIKRILNYKTSTVNGKRVQNIAAILLDTGLRIDELLGVRQRDVDLEGMMLTVNRKGRIQQQVPISFEGRKWLHLWIRGHRQPDRFVFDTESGSPLSIRNCQRDIADLCRKVGIEGVRCSPHTFRHTFAVSYLRNRGNLFYLSKILGHSSIKTTERYLRSLTPDDLAKVHNDFSPLSNQG